jgi:hypothetical protein
MKKQYFILKIKQSEAGTDVSAEYETTAAFLSKFLGKVLKMQPELIPIFLDATGAALIGDLPPETQRCEILANFTQTPDERFYDEILG